MNLLGQFSPNKNAVINPSNIIKPVEHFPQICIASFSREAIEKFASEKQAVQIAVSKSANGSIPIYQTTYQDTPVAFFMSPVGAPAAAAMLEEVIAMGGKKFVFFGACGVLHRELTDGHLIVPTHALRDEGTSYHYRKEDDEIELETNCVNAVTSALDSLGLPYTTGKTWTTDAVYRETHVKTSQRRQAGCIAVEMECSALAAVASFRNVKFAQFFYSADNLDAPVWEPRCLLQDELKSSYEDQYMVAALECGIRL